jgi:hypothetical protein
MLKQYWGKISWLVGAVITIAGVASFQSWRDLLGSVGWAIRDNPVSAAVVALGLVVIVVGNWDTIKRLTVGSKRWRTDKELGDEIHGWLRRNG